MFQCKKFICLQTMWECESSLSEIQQNLCRYQKCKERFTAGFHLLNVRILTCLTCMIINPWLNHVIDWSFVTWSHPVVFYTWVFCVFLLSYWSKHAVFCSNHKFCSVILSTQLLLASVWLCDYNCELETHFWEWDSTVSREQWVHITQF